jgi:hypothetical protein
MGLGDDISPICKSRRDRKRQVREGSETTTKRKVGSGIDESVALGVVSFVGCNVLNPFYHLIITG